MVKFSIHEVKALLNRRKQRVLDLAELAVPSERYATYRKLVLDELGDKGLEGELMALLRKSDGQGMDGLGDGRE